MTTLPSAFLAAEVNCMLSPTPREAPDDTIPIWLIVLFMVIVTLAMSFGLISILAEPVAWGVPVPPDTGYALMSTIYLSIGSLSNVTDALPPDAGRSTTLYLTTEPPLVNSTLILSDAAGMSLVRSGHSIDSEALPNFIGPELE